MTGPVTPVRPRAHLEGGPPHSRSRLRWWSVAVLVLATALGGTALATAGTAGKGGSAGHGQWSEYGLTGTSPRPLPDVVSSKTKFRVATFNILGWDHTAPGGTKRGYADGTQRMKWAVQLLKSNDVDVVGLQEFQPQQYDKWIKKASGRYDIWPGYIDTVGFLRNSIAWRRDAFTMVSNTWVKLPYFHGDVLRMPVVLLRSNETGQQFYVMNFQNPADVRGHADGWRKIGQRIQIALVNALRASNNLPIIWTGDMNTREQVFCRVTAEAGMVAANGGYGDATTCQPPSGMIVDWIFGSGVKFKRYEQIRDGKVARTSDHHLVVTKAKLQPAAALVPPLPLPVVTCATATPTPTPTPVVPTSTVTPTGTATPSPTPTPTPTPVVTCATYSPPAVIFPTTP